MQIGCRKGITSGYPLEAEGATTRIRAILIKRIITQCKIIPYTGRGLRKKESVRIPGAIVWSRYPVSLREIPVYNNPYIKTYERYIKTYQKFIKVYEKYIKVYEKFIKTSESAYSQEIQAAG